MISNMDYIVDTLTNKIILKDTTNKLIIYIPTNVM